MRLLWLLAECIGAAALLVYGLWVVVVGGAEGHR